ncbi:hypothetical protein [Cyanobacterium aponinum]|uniref:Uncharacterized protein n=1 Tax=Cyanobacterium aponinum (strain PCC 10605) TaxID=755178 RepID=K9Z3P3_CYAAP|nr:hypothetical protein [Cyanobacterium aponinum]AFZ53180.1 hypothetical protein Cyan10605_1054 [Cyanobacterium aponinum PCC 10605]
MSKLLISLLFFTGLIFNFTLSISPVFSHEGYSHFREKYKSPYEINNNRFTKDNDDKKEEKDKEEDHKGHHQH